MLLQQFHVGNRQVFALLEWRQIDSFFILSRFLPAEYATPPGFFHHRTFHREIGISGGQHGGSNIFHAPARKGFQHTPGYQFIHSPFVFGEFAGQVLGNNQGVVVSNFAVIHAAAVQGYAVQPGCIPGKAGVLPQQGNTSRHFIENVLRYVAASGSGV